jgi:hypothetical protein
MVAVQNGLDLSQPFENVMPISIRSIAPLSDECCRAHSLQQSHGFLDRMIPMQRQTTDQRVS